MSAVIYDDVQSNSKSNFYYLKLKLTDKDQKFDYNQKSNRRAKKNTASIVGRSIGEYIDIDGKKMSLNLD